MNGEVTNDPATGMSRRDLALVCGVALLLRWLAVFELSTSELAAVPVGDARGYVDWARRIAAGDWFGSEVFYQAPLYPYVLGIHFGVFGEGFLFPRLLQGILGALASGMIAALTTRMASIGAGRIAGFAAALYSPWIWSDGLLQKTSLGLFLLALLFLLCERLGRSKSPHRAAMTIGIVAGLLTLTRENAAILILPCSWFLMRTAGRRALAFAATGLALVLIPVGMRNAALGGSFLPTASNAGVNLYIGNGPHADGFYVPLLGGRGHIDYEAADARRFAEEQSGRELSPGEVSGFFANAALHEIGEDPLRCLGLAGRKLLFLVNGAEYMDAVSFEAYRQESWVLNVLGWPLRFWLVLPLAAIGMWSRPRNRLALLLMLAMGALVVSLLPFFVTGRFRMGLVPLLLPFVGVGAMALREQRRLGGKGILQARALGLALLVVTLLPLPWHPAGNPITTSYANIASELLRQGEYERAEAAAAKGLLEDPGDAAALFNHGLALKFLGRHEEAEDIFTDSIREGAEFAADAWAELGSLHAMRSRFPAAERALGRALSLDPGHDMANYYRGLLRRQEGQLEEAAAAYQLALLRRASFSDARHNLAHVRLAQGRAADAISSLIETLQQAPDFRPSLKLLPLLLATHPNASLRDGTAALGYADRALAINENDPEVLATRAFALAELGRFDEALAQLERARSLDPVPSRWDDALARVRSGKPFHVDPLPSD